MKHIAVKSLLSVMLSLMMVVVFTPAIAFADEPEAVDETQVLEPVDEPEFIDEAAEIPAEDIDVDITETQGGLFGADQLKRAKKFSPAKEAYSDISVTNVSNWDAYENAPISYVTFARTDECTANGYYCVVPVEIKKGILLIEGARINSSPTVNQRAKIAVFSNATCTKLVDGYAKVSADYSDHFFKIPTTKTYYLAVGASASGWDTADQMSLSFYAERLPVAKKGMTLKDEKIYGVRCGKGKTTTFKYKPTSAGITSFDTIYELTKATLKNSKGKTLAAQTSRYYDAQFGVKRTTYKVSFNAHKKSTAGGYMIGVTNNKLKHQSGPSKSKAKALAEGSMLTGRIVAGSSKAQWFKFKNTEKSLFGIQVLAITNYKFKVEVYKGKTKLTKWTATISYKQNGKQIAAVEPMPKGTYYIKISPVKKSCGGFGVYWGHLNEN